MLINRDYIECDSCGKSTTRPFNNWKECPNCKQGHIEHETEPCCKGCECCIECLKYFKASKLCLGCFACPDCCTCKKEEA